MTMLSKVPGRLVFAFTSALLGATGLAGSAGAQTENKVIRVGTYSLPAALGNPYFSTPAVPQIYVLSAVFDTLTYVDMTGTATPGLAAAWKNIDRTTWQFTVRPGTQFANGEPLNAETIVANIQWFLSEDGQKTTGGRTFGYLASAQAVSPDTVEIKMKEPRPIFPKLTGAMYIVPPKAFRDTGIEKFSANPIGTGPYQPSQWTADSVKLAAFENSWRKPKTRNLEFSVLPELAARVQALVSNQIDIAIQLSTDDVRTVERAGHRVDVVASPLIQSLGLVTENPSPGVDVTPIRDRRVRQAMNLAVDKEAISKDLLAGIFPASGQLVTPMAFGHDPSIKPYAHDPAQARRLLADAGYPNGFPFVAEVSAEFASTWQKMAQDLNAVGIRTELRTIPFSDFIRKFLGGGWAGGGFNLQLGTAPQLDAMEPMRWQSCRKQPAYYCNRDQMALLDQIDVEFDEAKRKAMLNRMLRELHDDAAVLYLVDQKDLHGVSSRLKGFANVNRVFKYEDMTIN